MVISSFGMFTQSFYNIWLVSWMKCQFHKITLDTKLMWGFIGLMICPFDKMSMWGSVQFPDFSAQTVHLKDCSSPGQFSIDKHILWWKVLVMYTHLWWTVCVVKCLCDVHALQWTVCVLLSLLCTCIVMNCLCDEMSLGCTCIVMNSLQSEQSLWETVRVVNSLWWTICGEQSVVNSPWDEKSDDSFVLVFRIQCGDLSV